MRVLHLIHTPRHSGAEILVKDLCLYHRGQGIDSAIASFAPPEDAFLEEIALLRAAGIDLYLPPTARKKIERVQFFRKVIATFQPHVVFGHSVLPAIYGRFALPIFKTPPKFVTVLHAASNDDFKGTAFQSIERILRYRTDHVVAVSTHGGENYRRRFGTIVPLTVIPNGISLERFRTTDRIAAREHLGLANETKLVMQIGRIVPVKQQDLSLRSLVPMLRDGKTKLWFAGLVEDQAYYRRLEDMVDRYQVGEHVAFLGSRKDVPQLLAAADLYLMPSKAEAHSIAMLEALAAGVQIIASDIATLSKYRSWPGVELIPVNGSEELFAKAVSALGNSKRYSHDLQRFTIEETARQYELLM